MTYSSFLRRVRNYGFTLAELRCDVRPTPELLEFIVEVGPVRYERYVLRLSKRKTPLVPDVNKKPS